MGKKRILSVSATADETGFSEAQLRWFLFNRLDNGLVQAGAVVRIGRRVMIDMEGFDGWLDGQKEQAA